MATLIRNGALASAVYRSAAVALRSRLVHIDGGETVSGVFKQSLNTAIRDIETHPRGKLFRRLIRYGPPDPDEPEALASDGETTLSDPECGLCVDFIYSHMVNRFKGELAELLALEPCVRLMKRLRREGRLPCGVHLYWGELVQERRRATKREAESGVVWGSFAKGADGLLVRQEPTHTYLPKPSLVVHGIVEVKSMARPSKQVLDQIERHRMRLLGGVRLESRAWPPDHVRFARLTNASRADDGLIRIMVLPSRWKLSRLWRSESSDAKTRAIVRQELSKPPVETQIEPCGLDTWKITLAWSQEALNEAAYEMTVWYMAQVGAHVFAKQGLPRGFEHRTPEQAGVNLAKHRLYTIGIRHVSERQARRAIRIYNAYCFGFALAADAKAEMLWPDDVPHEDAEQGGNH